MTTQLSFVADPSDPFGKLLISIEKLMTYTNTVIKQFPKYERHLLHDDIRKLMTDILMLSIVAWKRYHKKTTLYDLDTKITVFRFLIRQAFISKYITIHTFEVWSEHVAVIGKMVGGWIKSIHSSEKG